ncbi:MAG: DUF4388 domain-containing protein [Actinomycetes bacterium]
MGDPDLLAPARTVETILVDLGDQSATGCLQVCDEEGDEAEVYLRDGMVYAVFVPGRRPMLGARLISSGSLTPEALAEALEVQRTELQGWRLGELLVHLGYVDRVVVEAFVSEQVRDGLTDLLGWPVSSWKFRKSKKTRQDVAPPIPVIELLAQLHDRRTTWESIAAVVGGASGVPFLSSRSGASGDIVLDPHDWALLCKIDGNRNLAELAGECGFTLFEAGQVVRHLVAAGLADVQEPLADAADVSPDEVRAADVPEPAASHGDPLAVALAQISQTGATDPEADDQADDQSHAATTLDARFALDLRAEQMENAHDLPLIPPWSTLEPDPVARPVWPEAVPDIGSGSGIGSGSLEGPRTSHDPGADQPGTPELDELVAPEPELVAPEPELVELKTGAPERRTADDGLADEIVPDGLSFAAELRALSLSSPAPAPAHDREPPSIDDITPEETDAGAPADEAGADEDELSSQPGAGTTDPTAETTDTAALLRELSRLTFGEEPEPNRPGATPLAPPRPSGPPVEPPRRRRGLFGRT